MTNMIVCVPGETVDVDLRRHADRLAVEDDRRGRQRVDVEDGLAVAAASFFSGSRRAGWLRPSARARPAPCGAAGVNATAGWARGRGRAVAGVAPPFG